MIINVLTGKIRSKASVKGVYLLLIAVIVVTSMIILISFDQYQYNLSFTCKYCHASNKTKHLITTKIPTSAKTQDCFPDYNPLLANEVTRCKEIRRRISWGIVDYANRDGDAELIKLVKPIFVRKRLVVWSTDHHFGPISDIRSIIEPLGVEFIEHLAIPPKLCRRMCNCDIDKERRSYLYNSGYPGENVYKQISEDRIAAPDIARADAFLVSCSIPFVEYFARFNRSIIAVAAIRFDYTLWGDANRWTALNNLIGALTPERRHVFGANNLYDREYMHYFTGARPDYVPSFCGYTGEYYNPTINSFLYSNRPHGFPSFWTEPFDREYRRINATFELHYIRKVYSCGHENSDLVKHLGFVHLPYEVFSYVITCNKCVTGV